MSVRGVGITIGFTAWDAVNNVGKTGDSANFTLRWGKDGTYSAPTNSASEVDATNAKGEYKITLTNAEANCDVGQLVGVSSSTGIVIMPTRITFDSFPAVRINIAQAGASGTITLDSNASASDSLYNGSQIAIIAGTGAGQGGRIVTGYVGSTKVATVTPAWTTTPDSTSVFAVVPATVNVQTFGGTAGTFASGRPEVNTTHAAGTAWNSGAIGASTLASAAITAAKFATDAIDANAVAASAVAEIQSGLATAAALATIATNIGTPTDLGSGATLADNLVDLNTFNVDSTVSTDLAGLIATVGTAGVGLTALAPASTALSNIVWTNAKAAFITGDAYTRIGANGSGLTAITDKTNLLDAGVTSVRTGTAQAGSTTTITLDAGASSTSDFYSGESVYITSGPGAGQNRLIVAYNGTTKQATVDNPWVTNPTNASVFAVIARGNPRRDSSAGYEALVNVDYFRGSTATADAIAAMPAGLSAVQLLVEADVLIDTSTTPWAIVWMQRGTGGIGVGTELLRKRLFDVSGGNIGNTTTVLGRQME